jgi:hypothetical protein
MAMAEIGNNPTLKQTCARLLADAALVAVITLVFAAVDSSLAVSGVISMGAASVFLVFAFILIMIATFVFDHLWRPSWKHKAIVGVSAAVLLGALYWYEWKNYTPSIGSKEFLQQVLDAIKGTKNQQDGSPSASPQADAPAQSQRPNAMIHNGPSGTIEGLTSDCNALDSSQSLLDNEGKMKDARLNDNTIGKEVQPPKNCPQDKEVIGPTKPPAKKPK